MIDRFLYEKSVAYHECLIIPFVFSCVDGQNIYSYSLLSEQGYTSSLHQATNPAQLYSSEIQGILAIARQHLDNQTILEGSSYFRERYTYNHNLIVIHQAGTKCFYDHYAPSKLVNIAAPKIFSSSQDCITWIKLGLQNKSQ